MNLSYCDCLRRCRLLWWKLTKCSAEAKKIGRQLLTLRLSTGTKTCVTEILKGKANLNKKNYYMYNQKLESTSMEKDMGVVMISDLKSSQQSSIYGKASRILGMIKRTNLLIYYSSCISHWSDNIWNTAQYSMVSTLSEG